MVVFRLRDPALITNDNLESIMEEKKYSLEEYAMGITIPKEALEDAAFNAIGTQLGSAIDASTMTMATTGRYSLTDHMTGTTILKNHGKPVEIRPFEVYLDMEMLNDKSSAYNVEPETLANLWVARFGKGWVGNEVVEDMEADQVDWWRHAANRLRELGYLEMHTLASSYRVVLRIVE